MGYITATIPAKIVIRKTPAPTGKKITQLAGGNYTVISRDHQGFWLNIIYKTKTGTLSGWVPRKDTVVKSDIITTIPQIPVSKYENESYSDITKIINYRKSQRRTLAGWLSFLALIGFFATSAVFFIPSLARSLPLAPSVWLGIQDSSVFLRIIVVIMILFGAFILFGVHAGQSPKKFSYPVKSELEFLENVRKGKPKGINWGQVAVGVGAVAAVAAGVAVVASASKNSSQSASRSNTNYRSTSKPRVAAKTAVAAVNLLATTPNKSSKPAPQPDYLPIEPELKREEPGFGGALAGSSQEQGNIAAAIKDMQDRGSWLKD